MKKIAAEYIDINTLKPWDKNPRKNDHAVPEIVASIERFGFSSPIIARKSDNVIIAGHTRWKAAKQIGLKEVPVRFMDLDVVDSQLLAIADNKLNERATWDDNVLEQVLNELAEEDLTGLGFDDDELDNLLQTTTEDLQEEELPELEEEIHSQAGEIYELGKHKLLCGDSTRIDDIKKLTDNTTPDLIYTDPPYGMNAVSNSSVLKKNYKNDIIGDDNPDTAKKSFQVVQSLYQSSFQVWWGANYYSSVLPDAECWIVWDKNNGQSDQTDAELAWTNFRSVVRKYTKASEKTNRVHPTQKPTELFEYIVQKFKLQNTSTVLDLFGGSGSTLIAAEKNQMISFIIEFDPQYCDVIRRRWTKYAKENGLEVGSGGLE